MERKLNIALDADGIIFDLFVYQLEKGLKYFDKIDNTIKIDNKSIEDISTIASEEKEEFLIKYVDQYMNKTGDKIDIEKYDIHDVFNIEPTFIEEKLSKIYASKNGISELEALTELNNKLKLGRQIFWIRNIIDYCLHSDKINGVVEKIRKWQSQGHSVGNITARVFVTENTPVGALFRYILEKVYKNMGIKFDYIDYCSEKHSPEEKKIACYKRSVDIMIEDKLDVATEISKMELTKVCMLNKQYNKGQTLDSTVRCSNYDDIDEEVQNLCEQKNNHYIEQNNFCDENNELIDLSEEKLLSMNKLDAWYYYREQKEIYRNKDFSTSQYRKNYNIKRINLHYFIYKFAYPLVMLPYKFVVNPLVVGKKNILFQKGVIFAVNHLTMMDELLVASAIGWRNVNFLASSQFLKYPVIGPIYKNLGCIFVDRKDIYSKHNSSEIMKHLSANFKDEIIHVEGTRKRTNNNQIDLLPIQPGTIKRAKIIGTPIVPITITAMYGTKKGLPIVRIDEPIIIPPDLSVDDGVKKLTDIMLNSVRKNKMLEEEILKNGKENNLLYYNHNTGKKFTYCKYNKNYK